MKVIGLTGKKYAGKDEAAKALIEKGWERVSFADPLRAMLYALDPYVDIDGAGIRWSWLYDSAGYDTLKAFPEARRLMQVFGTEVMRNFVGEDVWVDMAREHMLKDTSKNYVITDVRFNNEGRLVRSLNGKTIRIVRNAPQRDEHGAEHASEAGIDDVLVDYEIFNDGSIEELHANVVLLSNTPQL